MNMKQSSILSTNASKGNQLTRHLAERLILLVGQQNDRLSYIKYLLHLS